MSTIALTMPRVKPLFQVIIGSLLLAAAARISIPLPFSPVPIALHPTMAVMLGIFLGPISGTCAVALYLLEGVAGLPVFSLGSFGFAYLCGPTGGYLLGFLPAAFIAGHLAPRLALASLAGHAAIYACGLPMLALYTGTTTALLIGLLPYIPGDILKTTLLARLMRHKKCS